MVLAGFSPFELQALKCREIYLHTRSLSDGVGPVDTDGRFGLYGPCSTDGAPVSTWERARRGYGSSMPSFQTGTFDWTGWASHDLQGDAGAHRTRVPWWIPAPNRERGDRALPPLRCERGFGAAHAGVLSSVDAVASRPHRGNRMGPLAVCDPRGTVNEREKEEGRDLLLWAGYALERGIGEGEGAELPSREDRPARARQTRGRVSTGRAKSAALSCGGQT